MNAPHETRSASSVLETVQIETPEHVVFSYEIAGPGSRAGALLIDNLLIGLALTGLFYLLTRLSGGEIPGAGAADPRWAAWLALIIVFVLYWGYFLAFEATWNGQTPGKKLFGVRAAADGGFPLTLQAAAVRNLLRLVDLQPFGLYFVGAVAMLLNREAKRLGDLTAGTLVIRDAVEPEPKGAAEPAEPEAPEAQGPPRLDDREFRVLEDLRQRRPHLARPALARLGERLSAMVADRYPPEPGEAAADQLERAWRQESARRRRRERARVSARREELTFAQRFVRTKEPRWRRFAQLVRRTRSRGLTPLSADDVSEFATLYRETAADLARARTYGVEPATRAGLERLVAAGHAALYQRGRPPTGNVLRFLRSGFPARVREHRVAIAVSAALLLLPALVGYVRVRQEPDAAHAFLSPEMIARAERAPERIAAGRRYVEIPEPFMPVLAGRIIANNVQVTFAAFAFGITAGLGTMLLLIFNGLHIGATLGLFDAVDAGSYLWSFVLPHGIVELTAATIAGGAGLLLGSALLVPGERTRREALVERGRAAVRLLVGTTALLILAGLVEGFVSPSALPAKAKMGFGFLLGALLIAYLSFTGTEEPSAVEEGSGRS